MCVRLTALTAKWERGGLDPRVSWCLVSEAIKWSSPESSNYEAAVSRLPTHPSGLSFVMWGWGSKPLLPLDSAPPTSPRRCCLRAPASLGREGFILSPAHCWVSSLLAILLLSCGAFELCLLQFLVLSTFLEAASRCLSLSGTPSSEV